MCVRVCASVCALVTVLPTLPLQTFKCVWLAVLCIQTLAIAMQFGTFAAQGSNGIVNTHAQTGANTTASISLAITLWLIQTVYVPA